VYFGYRAELTTRDQLVHLRNRDYDPATGTFLTPDPLDGVAGTTTETNPYHYADNDPLNKTDPLGLRPTDPFFGLVSPYPASLFDIDLCLPPGSDRCLTVPTPSNDDVLDKLETAARINALKDFALKGSPSPRSDQVGAAKAVQELLAGASAWVCREYEPDGPPAFSWKYRLPVFCVAPTKLLPPDAAAMTIGHWIFCEREEHCKMGNARKALEHEFWHVDQFEQFGDGFVGLYAYESARLLRAGEDPAGCQNRYERPAYQHNEGRCL
jgi:RHS repeat-associated protein